MKCSTALALLCTQLILQCTAIPTENGSEQKKPFHAPIQLEFGKEYTQTELDSLVAAQVVKSDATHTFNIGETSGTATAASVESPQDASLQRIPGGVHQLTQISYAANCPIARRIYAGFSMTIDYQGAGRPVHFADAGKSIGGWTKIDISRGAPGEIVSTAGYYRESCWFIPPGHMCSYKFFGTVKASIRPLRSPPHIKTSSFQENDAPPEKAGYVTETCFEATMDQRICPPIGSTRCSLLPIVTHDTF